MLCFDRRRIVRSAIVQGMSRLSSDIIINSFSVPFNLQEFLKQGVGYKYFRPTSIITWYLQAFLPLIFYAQFGYLYSFTPSAFDKDVITRLVQNSLNRNRIETGRVYDFLKEGTVTYFTAKTMSFMSFNKKTQETEKLADAIDLRGNA